jgi:hypothetical protein
MGVSLPDAVKDAIKKATARTAMKIPPAHTPRLPFTADTIGEFHDTALPAVFCYPGLIVHGVNHPAESSRVSFYRHPFH